MKRARRRLVVRGQVQGVGFRPFVFNLAGEFGLCGLVRNSPRGVVIEIQGPPEALDAFAEALRKRLPPLARITALSCEEIAPLEGESDFVIGVSSAGDSHAVLISPDTCVCQDCLADMKKPDQRRLRYPFTNCTNCGPRYTITRSIPYDRPATSMACFKMCPDCLAEYRDPKNRRFHAQPNACSRCGPKVWLTWGAEKGPGLPLAKSPPGREESGELPLGSRQGHDARKPGAATPAPPLAAPLQGNEVLPSAPLQGDAALRALAEALLSGRIAAIKGLGGFHLACDARNDAAVAALRQRKKRPHKPFAVMAADLDAVRAFADPGPEEEALLLGAERPIVLCRGRSDAGRAAAACRSAEEARAEDAEGAWRAGEALPGAVAGSGPGLSALLSPDTDLLGVMLPYAPLHFALFEHLAELAAWRGDRAAPVLVMTSGNPGGQPICLGNREALAHLGAMADLFLFHDRDILIRVDDSVLRCPPGREPLFYRRARGYVPRPLSLIGPEAGQGDAPGKAEPGEPEPDKLDPGEPEPGEPARGNAGSDDTKVGASPGSLAACVLGAGAELKNTLCLTKGDDAFVGQHIGDMANLESADFHEEIRDHLADLLRVAPALVVRDAHPDYLAGRLAEELAAERSLPLLSLQHHAAHGFALLAEHAFSGRALVLALDGTGLGEDGTLWGGECLLLESGGKDGPGWQRLAHLAPMDLPGGEAAIREPWRIAHALLLRLGLYDGATSLPWLPQRAETAAQLPRLVERGLNCPSSSSCGRLFDAVSALLGLCEEITYEGQAAIRLEAAQGPEPWQRQPERLYEMPLREQGQGRPLLLDSHALFAGLAGEILGGAGDNALRVAANDALSGACGHHAPGGDCKGAEALWPPEAFHLRSKQTEEQSGELALRFHHSLARGLTRMAVSLAGRHGIEHVGLSGGCLQNLTLSLLLARNLRAEGLKVLEHRLLPPGDGCISLGQAYWGWLKLRAGHV